PWRGPQAAVTSASIIVPSASIPAARQNRSKLARTSAYASSTAPVAGEPAGVISLVMALLSFVESAPRAYRLKVGNADLFRNSTEPGTSPWEGTMDGHRIESLEVIVDNEQGLIAERTIALRPYPAVKL